MYGATSSFVTYSTFSNNSHYNNGVNFNSARVASFLQKSNILSNKGTETITSYYTTKLTVEDCVIKGNTGGVLFRNYGSSIEVIHCNIDSYSAYGTVL